MRCQVGKSPLNTAVIPAHADTFEAFDPFSGNYSKGLSYNRIYEHIERARKIHEEKLKEQKKKKRGRKGRKGDASANQEKGAGASASSGNVDTSSSAGAGGGRAAATTRGRASADRPRKTANPDRSSTAPGHRPRTPKLEPLKYPRDNTLAGHRDRTVPTTGQSLSPSKPKPEWRNVIEPVSQKKPRYTSPPKPVFDPSPWLAVPKTVPGLGKVGMGYEMKHRLASKKRASAKPGTQSSASTLNTTKSSQSSAASKRKTSKTPTKKAGKRGAGGGGSGRRRKAPGEEVKKETEVEDQKPLDVSGEGEEKPYTASSFEAPDASTTPNPHDAAVAEPPPPLPMTSAKPKPQVEVPTTPVGQTPKSDAGTEVSFQVSPLPPASPRFGGGNSAGNGTGVAGLGESGRESYRDNDLYMTGVSQATEGSQQQGKRDSRAETPSVDEETSSQEEKQQEIPQVGEAKTSAPQAEGSGNDAESHEDDYSDDDYEESFDD